MDLGKFEWLLRNRYSHLSQALGEDSLIAPFDFLMELTSRLKSLLHISDQRVQLHDVFLGNLSVHIR